MSIRILVVDNDRHVLTACSRVLQRAGYSVVGANNAGEALIQLASAQNAPGAGFDLVISDYDMPGMTGDGLCRAIKSLYDLPVILLSGGPIETIGAACGADFSSMKPIDNADLIATVARLVDRSQGAAVVGP